MLRAVPGQRPRIPHPEETGMQHALPCRLHQGRLTCTALQYARAGCACHYPLLARMRLMATLAWRMGMHCMLRGAQLRAPSSARAPRCSRPCAAAHGACHVGQKGHTVRRACAGERNSGAWLRVCACAAGGVVCQHDAASTTATGGRCRCVDDAWLDVTMAWRVRPAVNIEPEARSWRIGSRRPDAERQPTGASRLHVTDCVPT